MGEGLAARREVEGADELDAEEREEGAEDRLGREAEAPDQREGAERAHGAGGEEGRADAALAPEAGDEHAEREQADGAREEEDDAARRRRGGQAEEGAADGLHQHHAALIEELGVPARVLGGGPVQQRRPRGGEGEARREEVRGVSEDEPRATEGRGARGARRRGGDVEDAHGWSPQIKASAG